MTLLLLLLTACAADPDDAPCPVQDTSNTECPFLPETADCGDVDAAIRRCIDRYGMGLRGDNEQSLLQSCAGNDCGSSQYLSLASALCAAQVQGLVQGLARCGGDFTLADAHFVWVLHSLVEESCVRGIAANESQLLQLDARTGLAEAEAVDYIKGLCESNRSSTPP